MSGISSKDNKIVVVATTNYLNHLDKAINNRPSRFNRLYKFDYPTNDEISDMIKLYFKGCNISDKMIELCYDNKFTGSHIEEIKRSAERLSLKRNCKIEDVFIEVVEIVKKVYSVNISNKVGF